MTYYSRRNFGIMCVSLIGGGYFVGEIFRELLEKKIVIKNFTDCGGGGEGRILLDKEFDK